MIDWPRRLRSVRLQLPLGIASLLVVVVTAFSVVAYYEVRAAAWARADARLEVAATRLAALVSDVMEERLAEVTALSEHPGVIRALQDRDLAGESFGPDSTAGAVLEDFMRTTLGTRAVRLWAADGELVASVGEAGGASGVPGWVVDPMRAFDGFHAGAEGPWYAVSISVVDPEGGAAAGPDGDGTDRRRSPLLGYLVQERWVTTTGTAAGLIRDLVGTDGSFALGRPGGRWIDLTTTVDPPPMYLGATEGSPEAYRTEQGQRHRGLVRAIPGTPWQVWVDVPAGTVLERPRLFLVAIVPGGLVVILAGMLAGWALSSRLIRRLDEVKNAARAIASGEPAAPVSGTGRGDELDELAEAFNRMATRVDDAKRDLEARVEARTAELHEANRDLESFSYSVSHDLRAPLRVIQGFAEALDEDHGARLGPGGREQVARIQTSADRMTRLIDDLLALSQLTRREISRREVDLSAVVGRIVRDLREREPERRVDVRVAEHVRAYADPGLVTVVVTNLLDNAWKFTADTEGALIEFGNARLDGTTAYYIRDNGVGFDMEYAERLFGVFQRFHPASDFPGTGIGLATVRRLVRRHGGRVWAVSKPRRGATFYFTLGGGGRPATPTRRADDLGDSPESARGSDSSATLRSPEEGHTDGNAASSPDR